MLSTRTGGFPIGFRRGWSDWQKDLPGLIAWAKANHLAVIDVGGDAEQTVPEIVAAGLGVGSADLKSWSGFLSADPAKRADAVAANESYIANVAAAGAKNFFTVMLPEETVVAGGIERCLLTASMDVRMACVVASDPLDPDGGGYIATVDGGGFIPGTLTP